MVDEKGFIVLPDFFNESFQLSVDLSDYWTKFIYIAIVVLLSFLATKASHYMFRRPENGIRSGPAARANLMIPTLIWTATAATTLYVLNVTWASVVVILGGASVGVSFALGPIMSNVASSYINVMDGAFREGEVVKLSDGTVGTVNEIGLYSTEVLTPDEEIRVPNSLFRDGIVTNLSRRPGYRGEVIVPIDDKDLGTARVNTRVLGNLFDGLISDGEFDLYEDGFGHELLNVRKADWGYHDIHGEALQIKFRLWATDPMEFFYKRHKFLKRFMNTCEDAGISYGYTAHIASPQGLAVEKSKCKSF